jgi:hypothetical protein
MFSDTQAAALLHHSVNQGDVAAVQALLTQGAVDVDARNGTGETAVHVAVARRLHRVLELLLRYDADATCARDARTGGTTALHDAALLGDTAAVRLLIDFGANPSAPDATLAQTPLHYAAEHGLAPAAQMLLARGADAAARDKLGRTALALAEAGSARSPGHAAVVALLRTQDGTLHSHEAERAAIVQRGGPIAALTGTAVGGAVADGGAAVHVAGTTVLPAAQFLAQKSAESRRLQWVNTARK